MKNRNQSNSARVRGAAGFTILELLAAITVLAVFLTLALPNFQAAIQNNRLTSATNGFLTAMQFARSEALSRREPVSVCGSSDGATCNDDWETGWIVFVDDNDAGDTTAVIADPNDVLRVWPSFAGDATNSGDDPAFVRFLPNGAADADAGSAYPIEFTMLMPNCTRDNARTIEIERTGRVSAERVDCP